eukprot:g73416.t1
MSSFDYVALSPGPEAQPGLSHSFPFLPPPWARAGRVFLGLLGMLCALGTGWATSRHAVSSVWQERHSTIVQQTTRAGTILFSNRFAHSLRTDPGERYAKFVSMDGTQTQEVVPHGVVHDPPPPEKVVPKVVPKVVGGNGRFRPRIGLDKMVVRPGPLPPLESFPLHSQQAACLFGYGPLLANHGLFQELVAETGARVEPGRLYGAAHDIANNPASQDVPDKDKSGAVLGYPTGMPSDFLEGQLLCYKPVDFPAKLRLTDRVFQFDEAYPDVGAVRRGLARAIRSDGSSTQVIWYFQDSPEAKKTAKKLPASFSIPNLQESDYKPFRCPHCSQSFAEEDEVREHIVTTHPLSNGMGSEKDTFHCLRCVQSFKSANALNLHMRTHQNDLPFQCRECGALFHYALDLKAHYNRKHVGQQPFKCEVCGTAFRTLRSMTIHMKAHSGNLTAKPLSCPHCNRTFGHGGQLKEHIRRAHTGERPYKCQLCPKAFARSSDLTIHIRCHTGEKAYNCTECSKAFATKTNLKTHMRTHTGEKPYKCSSCVRAYARSDSLRDHIRRHHTGERPFNCSFCPARFASGAEMSQHVIAIHTGAKNFTCPDKKCDRVFTTKGKANEHYRLVHSPERPFVCREPECGKRYATNAQLAKHIKSKHGNQSTNTTRAPRSTRNPKTAAALFAAGRAARKTQTAPAKGTSETHKQLSLSQTSQSDTTSKSSPS